MKSVLLVETNFIVGWALQQDRLSEVAVKRLFALLGENGIALALPAFCFEEAQRAIRGEIAEQIRLEIQLEAAERETSRSGIGAEVAATLKRFRRVSLKLRDETERRRQSIFSDLQTRAVIIPLDGSVLRSGLDGRTPWGLELPDALVLVSCEAFLRARRPDRAVFPTADKRFKQLSARTENEPVVGLLRSLGCEIEVNFDAIAYRF